MNAKLTSSIFISVAGPLGIWISNKDGYEQVAQPPSTGQKRDQKCVCVWNMEYLHHMTFESLALMTAFYHPSSLSWLGSRGYPLCTTKKNITYSPFLLSSSQSSSLPLHHQSIPPSQEKDTPSPQHTPYTAPTHPYPSSHAHHARPAAA